MKYSLNDTVSILIATGAVAGVVTHVGLDFGGEIYLVRYVDARGEVHTDWFRAEELS